MARNNSTKSIHPTCDLHSCGLLLVLKGGNFAALLIFYVMNRQNIIIPRNDLAIRRSYQVEVPLNNTGVNARNYFLRNDILNPKGVGSVLFTGMEVYTSDFFAKTETGRDTVSPTDATKLALTLMFKEKEVVYYFPYIGLISALNFGMIRRLNRIQIDLTKSYITILDSGIAANRSAVVNFFFDEKNEKE